MNMKILKIVWILFFPLLIVSCDEDPVVGCMDDLAINYNAEAEEEGSCEYDLSVMLTSHTWYVESVTTNLDGVELDLLVALPDLLPPCTHDNLFTFSEEGTVNMDDHIVLCEEGEESLIDLSGEWIVDGSQLTIIQEGQEDNPYELQVENQTGSSMDLVFPYSFSETIIIPAKIVLVAN